MLRSTSLAAALALALPLHAQTPLRIGQTVRGELAATDRRADDRSYYDLYTFRGRRGEHVTFTLRSTAFDAYLSLGRMAGAEWDEMQSDDDGAGGTDARLDATLPADGDYLLRANTLSAGETGAYTLTVSGGAAAPPARAAAVSGTIRMGQTVNGSLDAADPTLDDQSHFDLWSFAGREGERVEVVMRSAAFDSHLTFGRMSGGALEELRTDDDGAGGNDARIRITLPAAGEYAIRANSVEPRRTGAYTLAVGAGPAAAPVPRPHPIRAGQTVGGTLSAGDARADDDSFYDAWSFEGRAGERILVTLRSAAFDAYLSLGQGTGDAFQPIRSDDDGAGGTDAQIEATLPRTGTYVIRANTLGASESGAYTLTLARR